jgi:hypothetical protein
VIGLTVAVATGGKWFDVWPCEQGRVLLVLAETTPEQVKRRLHWYLRDVPAAPMAAALANITPLAAAGAGGLALIHDGDTSTGDLPETVRAVELRDILKAAVAERHPYSLVVLDPSVRFAGAHSEKDNGAATRYVEVLETLALPECGAPTVLLPAHTRKPTERSKDAAPGSTDALRGASGLRDAVRWVGMLEERRGIDGAPRLLDLKVGKANDAHKPSIVLCADDDREGALRAATLEEIDTYDAVTGKRKSARGDDLRAEVLKALEAGSMSGRVLAEQLHRNRDHLRPVMEQLQREGKVVSQPGPKRATVWSLAAPTADAEAEHAAAVLLGGSPHAP